MRWKEQRIKRTKPVAPRVRHKAPNFFADENGEVKWQCFSRDWTDRPESLTKMHRHTRHHLYQILHTNPPLGKLTDTDRVGIFQKHPTMHPTISQFSYQYCYRETDWTWEACWGHQDWSQATNGVGLPRKVGNFVMEGQNSKRVPNFSL
jgi:hypothetical protein